MLLSQCTYVARAAQRIAGVSHLPYGGCRPCSTSKSTRTVTVAGRNRSKKEKTNISRSHGRSLQFALTHNAYRQVMHTCSIVPTKCFGAMLNITPQSTHCRPQIIGLLLTTTIIVVLHILFLDCSLVRKSATSHYLAETSAATGRCEWLSEWSPIARDVNQTIKILQVLISAPSLPPLPSPRLPCRWPNVKL